MEKKRFIAILVVISCIMVSFVSCNVPLELERFESTSQDAGLNGNTEKSEPNQSQTQLGDDYNVATEIDDSRVVISSFSWNGLHQGLIGENITTNAVTNVSALQKNQILAKSVDIEGYEVYAIYTEYNLEDGQTDADWDLTVDWNLIGTPDYGDDRISLNLFYRADGYDAVGVTRLYTLVDEENNVYSGRNSHGDSHICLINDNIFIRFVIPADDCERPSEITEQLLDYAFEIKDIVTVGDVK